MLALQKVNLALFDAASRDLTSLAFGFYWKRDNSSWRSAFAMISTNQEWILKMD